MRNPLRNFFCWLGRHDWYEILFIETDEYIKECKRCGSWGLWMKGVKQGWYGRS